MSLARVAGGLLSGLGRGLEAEGLARQQTERDEALHRRAIALARYGHDLGVEREGVNQRGRLELDTHQTRNKIVATREELGVRGQLDAANDDRTAAREAANDYREFQIWLRQQPIELQSQLTIEDYRNDRQDQRTAFQEDRQDNRTVVARGVDDQGNVAVGYASDRNTRIEGMSPTPTSGDDIFAFPQPAPSAPAAPRQRRGLMTQSSGGPASADAAAPSQSGQRPTNTYTVEEYNATLREAAQDPRFRGMPQSQIREIVDRALREQGLRLAPNGR